MAKDVSRELGAITATSIVAANMIGAGILTTTGLMAKQLPGPIWILGCWFLGGMIALAGALCYAELGSRMPEEGGEYVYLKRLYHPLFGFLTGWTSFIVGFSVPIASSALGFVEYLFAGLDFGPNASSAMYFALKKSTAVFIILVFTTIHYLGLKLGAKVQNVLTAMKITSIFGLAIVGVLAGGGQINPFSIGNEDSFQGIGFGTAMMFVMFAYSGWNASTYVAGELKKPRKTLLLSLVSGTLIVMILYLITNFFILKAVPYQELKGQIAVLELASVKTFGTWMGNGLSLLIGMALLSSLSAFILIGPRVYFAMAKDRLFLPFASQVHPKYGVPGRSILIQATIAVTMVTIGSYERLLIYMGFALNIFPWLAITGLFIGRARRIGEPNAFHVIGYPVIPLFFLSSSLLLMIVNYFNRPIESTAAVITIVFGIPCYYIWINRFGLKKSD